MAESEFVYVTYIRTTPEKLWSALTEPQFTRQYWGGGSNVSDWQAGSKWEHVHGGDHTSGCCTAGEVLESDPPRRLVMTWADPGAPDDSSCVTFEIEPIKDMVRLNVIHGGFKPGSVMAGKVSGGWPLVLSSLKSYLETGEGIDIWAPSAPVTETAAVAV